MTSYLDTEKLASLVSKKRGSRTLRDASIESNISISTLSRVENGNSPDMGTFALLCDWLEVPPCILFGNTDDIKFDTCEAISIQIRSDPNLDKAMPTAASYATVLLTLIKVAYHDLSQRKS